MMKNRIFENELYSIDKILSFINYLRSDIKIDSSKSVQQYIMEGLFYDFHNENEENEREEEEKQNEYEKNENQREKYENNNEKLDEKENNELEANFGKTTSNFGQTGSNFGKTNTNFGKTNTNLGKTNTNLKKVGSTFSKATNNNYNDNLEKESPQQIIKSKKFKNTDVEAKKKNRHRGKTSDDNQKYYLL